MAWNTHGGYRDRYLGRSKILYNRALAWVAARTGVVPANANENQLRNGSMFYNDHIIVDYDFSEYGQNTVWNRAPNQIVTSLAKTGGEWVRDLSVCTSGITTSGSTGNARGTLAPFISSVKTNKQFAIDFWMTPHDFTDTGPPRILEIAPDTGNNSHSNCNISILQGSVGHPYNGQHLQVRLRATNESTDLGGWGHQATVASNCLSGGGLMQHVTVNCIGVAPDDTLPAKVIVSIYVDGGLKEINEIDLPIDYTYDDIFDNWNDSYILSLFDSSHAGGTSGSRQWDGGIYRLRFWDTSLPNRMPYDLYLDGPEGDLTCNQIPPGGQQGRPGGTFATPPYAWNDHYSTSFGFVKVLDVLHNDQAFGGKTIDVATLRTVFPGSIAPLSGTVTVDNNEGKITYSALDQPDSTPEGVDVFTYRFRDSHGKLSNDASVYVTVASAGTNFVATEEFDYNLNPPGRMAPYGHINSIINFAGGPVSGDLVSSLGMDWVIPWKSTTGPNNDYFKIENSSPYNANAHNIDPDIELSGFALLYPSLDSLSTGRIEITTPGVYENFISYKPIKIKVAGVTLRNFIMDACMGAPSIVNTPAAIAARQRLWDLHNSTDDYDPGVALEGLGTTDTSAGPSMYYNSSQTGYNYKKKSGHLSYGIQSNDGGSNPDPTNTLITDGLIKGGTSTVILTGNGCTVKRCNISEGGGDAIKNSGLDVCCAGNWIHHNGFAAGAHADAFQTTSHSSGIDIIGNFADMPNPGDSGNFNISPYKSNAVYIAGQTKGSLVNARFVGNWAMGGNSAIYYGMGEKFQDFSVSGGLATSTSASESFSLTSGQFFGTPTEAKQFIASSVDHPNLSIQKRICKKSGEDYWWEVPSRLWSYIDASGIIVSGDATVAGGWDEAQCSGNTYHAAWGWVNQDDRPCDLMFRPTLVAEHQFGDNQPGGRYTSNSSSEQDPMKGDYRLVNKDSCQCLGYYGNNSSNYAPKPMLNFVVADNRWGEYSNHSFGGSVGANDCHDLISGGDDLTLSGTLSGMLFSGNYWDYTNQLMGPPGTNPPTGGLPDYNTQTDTASLGSAWMNDLCIPLSGLPHFSTGGGRRSLGDCPDLSAGIPWTGPAIDNFDIEVGNAPCGPPWCL